MSRVWRTMVLVLCFSGALRAQQFSVTYDFSDQLATSVESEADVITLKGIKPGGAGLKSQEYVTYGRRCGWNAQVASAAGSALFDAAIRIDLEPRPGYSMVINEIRVEQRSLNRKPVQVRICCAPNGAVPDLKDAAQSSPETALTSELETYAFRPEGGSLSSADRAFASIYICADAPADTVSDWIVNKIVVSGSYQLNRIPQKRILVSGEQQQQLRFGIDAERLWFWYPSNAKEQAKYAVGMLKVDYVRVAINCAYEREEGDKRPEEYLKILNMMGALKNENPQIKFFASPRPLAEAYSPEETASKWRGKCPWSPYPEWILPWEPGDGVDAEGNPKWDGQAVDAEKLLRYFADYLNLMNEKGFRIDYLDVTNEKNIPSKVVDYLAEHLPKQLNDGVHMPLLVAPSSWSLEQGVEWLNNANADSYAVASSHNTGKGGTPKEFADKGRSQGKEVWNTELHDWVGIEPEDEILNSAVLWEHIRGGFNGIDSWLFFGPANGKDHTMLWCSGSNVSTSRKYEIFKKLVNHANRGFYLESSMPRSDVLTAAFVRDKVVTIWVLNQSDESLPEVGFAIDGIPVDNKKIEVTRWHSSVSKKGETYTLSTGRSRFFTHSVRSRSLYCFLFEQ